VVYWNAGHGWASFVFQGGRALGGSGLRFDTLVAALVGPALYLFPWIWYRLVSLLLGRGRKLLAAETPAAERFLVTQAVLPLGVFLAVAVTRPVLPHWTLVGFLPLFPMLGRTWESLRAADPARFRWRAAALAALPVFAAAVGLFHARTGFFQQGRPGGLGLVAASSDPTADLVGWDDVAAELRRRGLLDRPGTFLFTSSWYHSGQLAFAVRGSRTPVLCYHAWDARSFAFWSDPAEWVGRDGVLVVLNGHPGEPDCFRPWFRRIEPLGGFEVRRRGAPVRRVDLYLCARQTSTFPFDDLGRNVDKSRRGGDAARRVASGSADAVR
jgi:hypothetical protein